MERCKQPGVGFCSGEQCMNQRASSSFNNVYVVCVCAVVIYGLCYSLGRNSE
jgi:hypothetical protein